MVCSELSSLCSKTQATERFDWLWILAWNCSLVPTVPTVQTVCCNFENGLSRCVYWNLPWRVSNEESPLKIASSGVLLIELCDCAKESSNNEVCLSLLTVIYSLWTEEPGPAPGDLQQIPNVWSLWVYDELARLQCGSNLPDHTPASVDNKCAEIKFDF